MGMRKLNGHHKAEIWEGEKDDEKGIKGAVKASISFDVTRPRCDRCTNQNRRVVILVERYKTTSTSSNLRLCMDCLANLIEGINVALQEYKLVRLIITGLPINDAIEEILQGDLTDANKVADLQASLDYMADMMWAATGETENKKKRKAKEVESSFDDIDV